MRGPAANGVVVRDPRLDEEIHRFTLPSGLRVLVLVKPGYHKKFAVVSANFGSVDQAFLDRESGVGHAVPDGTAHFLEHKLFERKDGDLFAVFSRHGASANAVTGFRNTSFFFTCSKRFERNLKTLLLLVREPEFTERGIEKERGIIAQEIRMYEDSPDWRCFMNLVQGLFVRHPVRVDVTGTVESIGRIDLGELFTCFRNFYAPGNLCLVVAGDVDPPAVADLAHREMGETNGAVPVRLPAAEPARVARRISREVAPVKRGKLILGFKDRRVPVNAEEQQRRDLLTGVLLALMFGSSSVTHQRLYESGVLDDTFYSSYAGEEDFGFVSFGAESDDPDALRRALLREIRRFRREGVSGGDFGRVVHRMIGRFVRGLDSLEASSFLLMSSAFRGSDPLRTPTLLRQITADDVMDRHAELFGDRNHSSSIVVPP